MFETEILTRTITKYDVPFMMDTACELVWRHFGRKVFVIRLFCMTFKEKFKIRKHWPFRLGFGFTMRGMKMF